MYLALYRITGEGEAGLANVGRKSVLCKFQIPEGNVWVANERAENIVKHTILQVCPGAPAGQSRPSNEPNAQELWNSRGQLRAATLSLPSRSMQQG